MSSQSKDHPGEGHHAGQSPSRRNSHAIDNQHHHRHQHVDGHGNQGHGHSTDRTRRLSQHSKETVTTLLSFQNHHLELGDRHRRASRFSFSTEGGDHHDGIRRTSQFGRDGGHLKNALLRSHRRSRGPFGREHDLHSEATSGDLPRPIEYENTYKLEPDSTFNPERVELIIGSVLRENLEGQTYERHLMGNRCLLLSDIIKERVKQLNLPRFKIVCIVLIGENKKQTTMISSRCLWNESQDNFASCDYAKGNLYAVGMVYAVYQE